MRWLRGALAFFATTLLTACVDPGQLGGFGCDDAGRCAGDAGGLANGASCGANASCASGACVSGVCCESACNAGCETCVAPGAEGTCTALAAGTECPAGGRCNGTGRTCPTACTTTSDCATGFACDVRGQCVDIDECQQGVCAAGTLCMNLPGSYRCTCGAGYELVAVDGGPSCQDVDECLAPGICGTNAECANGLGTYACGCLPGFRGSSTVGRPASCTDLDECGAGQNCGANAHCLNLTGSFVCACDQGTIGASVDGGAATCLMPNSCVSVACGANGFCQGTDAGYECACRTGFSGPVVPNGPTSCADIDECPSSPCGDGGTCTNTDGGFTCACGAGGFGAPANNQPATCRADPALLSSGVSSVGGSGQRAVPVGVPLPAGTRVVVIVQAVTLSSSSVSDNRGNRYRLLASSVPVNGGGKIELYGAVLTTALRAADTITAQGLATGLSWAIFASQRYVSLDRAASRTDNAQTTTPEVFIDGGTSTAPVFVVGSLFTSGATEFLVDGGFLGDHAVAALVTDAGSGAFVATVLPGGSQWFTAETSVARTFAGVLAAFHDLPQTPPGNVTVTHTPNARTFTLGWSGGVGSGGPGGCSVQYQNLAGTWTGVGSTYDCDSTVASVSLSLSSSPTWYGGNWSSVPLRMMRVDDNVVLTTLPGALTCVPMAASPTSTTAVDEDCNGDWNEKTCTQWDWVSSTVYQPPDGPCSATSGAPVACASTIDGTLRYTAGTDTTVDPSATTSSTSRGTSCSATDGGSVRWTCTGTGCTWQ